ncbi:MAG: MBL fold metallo-hydrolase [bacterium]|nr:MBL fold metallo-hydrolase [bacterium]
MNIIVVFDNYLYNVGIYCDTPLQTEWGFSCLIEGMEKTILFDTGASGDILLSNMDRLGIAPENVDVVFISHDHWDHTGGLNAVVNRNPKWRVIQPTEFSKKSKLCKGVWSTGAIGTWIKEQSLVLESKKGLVVITGCAHPGIVDILKKVIETFKQEIYLAMGGFHLAGWSDRELKGIIYNFKELSVKKVAPSHCSGERTVELFQQEYGQNFVKLGVGSKLEVKNGS